MTVTEEQIGAIRERWAAQWGRPPTGRELEGLIDEAVREEILYREAQRRGLDRDDAIIRRRLARKMTFLLEDSAEAPPASAGDIETYYADHAERYREPRRTTFRHVFLSRERRADPARDAAALLGEARAAAGDGWRRLGDPFALLREYADRTDQELAELFGGGFATALPALAAGGWQGAGRVGARRPPRAGDRPHRAAAARPRRGPGPGRRGSAGEPAARAERGRAADVAGTLRGSHAGIGGSRRRTVVGGGRSAPPRSGAGPAGPAGPVIGIRRSQEPRKPVRTGRGGGLDAPPRPCPGSSRPR